MNVRGIVLTMLGVAALAVGCRSSHAAAPAPSLIGTSWRAEEIDGRGVPERPESTLAFEDARRITGHTACNRYFGGRELGEGTIRLKPAGTTRIAWPPAVMDQESRFLAALGPPPPSESREASFCCSTRADAFACGWPRRVPGVGKGHRRPASPPPVPRRLPRTLRL